MKAKYGRGGKKGLVVNRTFRINRPSFICSEVLSLQEEGMMAQKSDQDWLLPTSSGKNTHN